jgi:hypothetical protein
LVAISPFGSRSARLAAREAAEGEEVSDLYRRPTGDEATDRLLYEIRADEKSHSFAVEEMRSGEGRAEPSPLAAPSLRQLILSAPAG